MGPDELQSYVDDARATIAESVELGRRNTELRLVEPFLECLGWDVRSSAVEAAYRVADEKAVIDYALLVDAEPAIFVDVLACEESLNPTAGEELVSLMAAADVEWGILTNGRTFAFVARRADGEDGFTCELDSLPDRASALQRFTPDGASEYVRQPDRRRAAARRILEHRKSLEQAIVDELEKLADEPEAVPREELYAITSSFVGELTETLATKDAAESAARISDPDPETAAASPGDGAQTGEVETPIESDGAGHPALDGDGEYVARLFDGSSTVGAVGGSSVAGTMKEVVDYLVDQHHLHAGLSLPYGPGDDDHAVINREPEHPNGDPMDEYVRLDSGPFLWTAGDLEERRERIEALAERVGLRVMFQADWARE
ncbi:hypothetical protein [Haloarchaeobius sp. HRN-SO-5]|uniref:hypothetical protein n=1 Tax=Haloarchaeobius sp. HRN-SO-5 TaxID=3446118 RepID=UPI003EBBFBE8